jgi:hypothetical protein
VTGETVATLTTDAAKHELRRDRFGYSIVTTSGKKVISERYLSRDEAGEWLDTVKACGGEVSGRV